MDEEELWNQAEELSKEYADISASEAFHRMIMGEYEGTQFDSRLRQLYYMLHMEDDEEDIEDGNGLFDAY